jgi:hypothetical protein
MASDRGAGFQPTRNRTTRNAVFYFNTATAPSMIARALMISLALTVSPKVASWPHVRGPAYDAHSMEMGLVNSWPANGPPVLWTRELGPGYSAFVMADNRAFVL